MFNVTLGLEHRCGLRGVSGRGEWTCSAGRRAYDIQRQRRVLLRRELHAGRRF